MALYEAQILQLIITAGSGLVGVGIGIGLFRNTIKQMQKDIMEIKTKQSVLRGGEHGEIPLFASRLNCEKLRAQCSADSSRQIDHISQELNHHTRAIKVLENFARWRMQKAGLKIEEINQILNMN